MHAGARYRLRHRCTGGPGGGARVVGIDVNAEMLETASERLRTAGLTDRVELREMGVAELDGEAPRSYDAPMSGLCFSELSEDEIRYTLEQVRRILKPGGKLLVADEVRPPDLLRRLIHSLLRAPLAAVTWLITQQTTHAVQDLPGKLAQVGFAVESIRANALGSFFEVVARAPGNGK